MLTLLAGGLLVTGASAGAMLRSSGKAVHRAARRSLDRTPAAGPPLRVLETGPVALKPQGPPVDVVQEFPELVSENEPAPLLLEVTEPDQATLFETGPQPAADYRFPTASSCAAPPPAPAPTATTAPAWPRRWSRRSPTSASTRPGRRDPGPRVTRYELQLAPGTKMSKVSALKDDLSYALATTEIRILAPIPGKQAVGVEVPNLQPNLVTLGDIYDELPATASPLAVWLGKDISGNAVWTDLARMPHLLIAGTTGSGKSGCINTILSSILLRATPDDVRMILIDPKRIELSYYEKIPHLLTPVVSSPKEAAIVLATCVAEMERRYERLAVRARNLPEANRACLARRAVAALPPGRDRRARRPDDDLPAGGRGRRHPARAEVARGRDPPRARHAAALGRRDHRDDQGQRPRGSPSRSPARRTPA